jgi:hypothetical protein
VPFAAARRHGRRDCAGGLARLVGEHWTESVGQDAMQAACAVLRLAEIDPRTAKAIATALPAFNTRVRYLGQDRTTRGDWPMLYGGEGYVLAAMGQTVSWFEGLGTSCRLALPGDRDAPRGWLDPAGKDIADPRALLLPGLWRTELAKAGPPPAGQALLPLLPGAPFRRAAWWDDHGEEAAFDELGPDLLVHLDIPAGEHRIAFYCLDFDWYATRHPRQQSVLIASESGEVLNAAWTGKFGDGVYERFAVTGPIRLTARFFKHRGACVAVSGVFFDRGGYGKGAEAFGARGPADGGLGSVARASAAGAADGAGASRVRTDTGSMAGLIASAASPRDAYLAVLPLFASAESARPEELRPALAGLLQACTDPVYQPLRAWALALWRKRGFEETAVTRHAQERLDLAMKRTGAAPGTKGAN